MTASLSQSAWAGTHVMAWVVYAVFVHVTENNDVVWRTWIPVAVPAILIPPLGKNWFIKVYLIYLWLPRRFWLSLCAQK